MSPLSRLSIPLRLLLIIALLRIVYIAPQLLSDVLFFRYSSVPPALHPKQKSVLENLSLSSEECAAAFPDLTSEIDAAAAQAQGAFELERLSRFVTQHVQGRISDGKLYIISTGPEQASDMLRRRAATLHQIHRALVTSPEPIPDTLFSLSTSDYPTNNSWTFSRPADQEPGDNYWPMPHYSFWSWAMPYIGPLDEAMTKISAIGQITPWSHKMRKAIWRGTQSFNPVPNPELRPNLLRVSQGKPWSDIEALKMGDRTMEDNNNIIPIEEFCKYRYIVYTEGVTYSGRLSYHQACASVVLTLPLLFLQHTAHLIRPLYASTISQSSKIEQQHKPPGFTSSFPTSYPPETSNMIFVANDWSNLESTIEWLEANPEAAERIAANQRELMVGKGYLSSAAEMCYWRALIFEWAKHVRPKLQGDKAWGKWEEEGVRWETYALTGKVGWD